MRRVGRAPALPPVDPNAVAALIAPSSPTPHRRASSPAHWAQASPLHRPHLRPAAGGRGHPVGAANPVTAFELSALPGAARSVWSGGRCAPEPVGRDGRASKPCTNPGSSSRNWFWISCNVAWSRSPNTTHLWVCLTVRVGPMGKHRSLRPTVIRRRQRGVAAIAVVGGAAAALAAVRHPRCRHRAAFGAQPMRPADRVTGLSTACTVSLAVLRRHRDFGSSTDWALGLAVCAWCSKGSLCLPAWASARACSTRWG